MDATVDEVGIVFDEATKEVRPTESKSAEEFGVFEPALVGQIERENPRLNTVGNLFTIRQAKCGSDFSRKI